MPHFPSKPRPTSFETAPHFPSESVPHFVRNPHLDHVLVWNETSLRRILRSYFHYYQTSRTHLALAKDTPVSRAVDRPENGRIVAIAQVDGLHHRYERRAA